RLGAGRATRARAAHDLARADTLRRDAAEAHRGAGVPVRAEPVRARRADRGARPRGERGAQRQDPGGTGEWEDRARHVARHERARRAGRRHRTPERGPGGLRGHGAEAPHVHRPTASRARDRPHHGTRAGMRLTAKVAAFQLVDVARSRWLPGYAAFFLLATELLLRFGGDPTRALVSLTTVVLFIVPLAAIVFATVYVHSAREFIELVLAQPVGRGTLFAGTYAAMVTALSAGVVVGIGIPFALRGGAGAAGAAAVLVAMGVALTVVFAGAGVALALRTEDRIRAFGLAPVYPMSADASRCASIITRARSMGFASVATSSGRSSG